MFSDFGVRWHKIFEAHELASKALVRSGRLGLDLLSPDQLFCTQKHPQTARNTASSHSALLLATRFANSTWRRSFLETFDQLNVERDEGSDSLACCLVCLLGNTWKLPDGAVWSPAAIWKEEISTAPGALLFDKVSTAFPQMWSVFCLCCLSAERRQSEFYSAAVGGWEEWGNQLFLSELQTH